MIPDFYETCPYDSVHRILRSRMQTHLTRCARNFSDASEYKKICPFNTCHVVDIAVLQVS